MKKHPEVVKAEAAVEAVQQKVSEARLALQRAEEDRRAAFAALSHAYHIADKELPRCVMVCTGRRGETDSVCSAVILRRTAAGRLSVRPFGAPHHTPMLFARTPHGWEFRDRKSRRFFATLHYTLRDVPAEFNGE